MALDSNTSRELGARSRGVSDEDLGSRVLVFGELRAKGLLR